jgi:hypothetical protein
MYLFRKEQPVFCSAKYRAMREPISVLSYMLAEVVPEVMKNLGNDK